MNNFDCKLLLILMEEENITKAAERLYMSQSTLSYRIKSLEKEMNCVLFERNKVGITPTRECRMVADYARQALKDYEAMRTRLSESLAPPEKIEKINFGAPTSIATRFFGDFLRSFQSNYPYAEVSWLANNSQVLVNMLRDETLDVAIVRSNLKWCGKKTLLFEEPLYLVSRHPLDLEKLSEETFINLSDIASGHLFLKWWKSHYGEERPSKTIEVNSIYGCLQLIDQDFGYSVIPALSLGGKKNYATQSLKWPEGQPLTQKTWCYYRADSSDFITNVFCPFIKENLPSSISSAIYRAPA